MLVRDILQFTVSFLDFSFKTTWNYGMIEGFY